MKVMGTDNVHFLQGLSRCYIYFEDALTRAVNRFYHKSKIIRGSGQQIENCLACGVVSFECKYGSAAAVSVEDIMQKRHARWHANICCWGRDIEDRSWIQHFANFDPHQTFVTALPYHRHEPRCPELRVVRES